MKNSPLNLTLLTDAELFGAIHDTKKQFQDLFTALANRCDKEKLSSLYPDQKGVKISMGNELEKCPYQVLDIFRNFDKKIGHNIRILNWWGHGLYILVFFGKDLALETLSEQIHFGRIGYFPAKGTSPWNYGHFLSEAKDMEYSDEEIKLHLNKFGYLQWYKPIGLEADLDQLFQKIEWELEQIFHFHRI